MRNFQKIKTLEDYKILDKPIHLKSEYLPDSTPTIIPEVKDLMLLRVLVRPKYGDFLIPDFLKFLEPTILEFSDIDKIITGIKDSWCYVTVRHGPVSSVTDDEFHFDGASFRTDIIPERNYIWVNNNPTEYKVGNLEFPEDFDPIKHNLFTFAAHQLADAPVQKSQENEWYLLSPFCLHRRPSLKGETLRTFYRICFTDIEGRDINNTPNPLLPTPFFGRDPVKTFRDKLVNYYGD